MQRSFIRYSPRHKLRLVLAGIAVTVTWTVIALLASTANATCYYSSSTSATFYDAPNDGDLGIAPEILNTTASLDGGCNATVNPDILYGFLLDSDSVGVYLDTDGNAATGDPVFQGADRLVLSIGSYLPGLGVWNGYSYSYTTDLPYVGAAGFVTTLDQLGVPGPTSIGIQVASMYEGLYDNYFDWAPEVGQPSFRFPVSFSTTPPPPPPPPPAPAAPAPLAPGPITQPKKKCTVPKLKGLTKSKAVRRLKKAGCKYRFVGTGKKVKSSSPQAGTRTTKRVVVRMKRTKKARRATAASMSRYEAAERAIRRAVIRGQK